MTAPERSILFTNYKLNRTKVFNEYLVQISHHIFLLFFKGGIAFGVINSSVEFFFKSLQKVAPQHLNSCTRICSLDVRMDKALT